MIDCFAIDEDAFDRLIDLFRRAAEPGVSQHARPWRPRRFHPHQGRTRRITRCPTVCLAATQGSVAVTDRTALQRRAEHPEELRQEKLRIAWRSALLVA
ncbi:MAG TPA: hypothetical protein VJX94_11485 [Stellaceae bacterium]|nr:hypothetical protein [Stellaceae bacterium]